MKPLDPRLLRHARASRRYVLSTAITGVLTAALVVAQALLIARAVAPVATGEAGWSDVSWVLGVLAVVLALRVLVLVVQEATAHRAAGAVVAELRSQVLEHAVALGPRWLAEGHGPRVVALAARGLDDLEPYFVRYLPQLLLAVTLTPATLAVVLGLDVVAAVTIAVTIPLIPVFMWLVGVLTQRYAADKLAAMQRLSTRLLDLLAGLSTLKALGRERGPGRRVGELGRAYTRTTMATLRVAFLSGAVLEFLTTLSVALVAVGVGMRLVYGQLDLATGLAVIMLAPEVYRPLREVGSHFHASADGVAAAEQAFTVLEHAAPPRGTRSAPDLRTADVVLDGVTVRAPGRDVLAPWRLHARVRPGRVTALVGPSGAGKTTAVLTVLGLVHPDEGAVRVETADGVSVTVADIDPRAWAAQVAWVPQRPVIVPGTLRENLLGDPAVPVDAVGPGAARPAGFAEVAERVGWDGVVGHGGAGLSVGERQRLALTRVLLSAEPLVVLDEPTAHLDAYTEQRALDVVRALRAQGRTVLLVAHRPSLVALADDVVQVTARAVDDGSPAPDLLEVA